MTPEKARAIWAIYVWCRRTDELVDGPNAPRMTPAALDRWDERLDAVFAGRPYDVLDAALADTVARFPVDVVPFRDMVRWWEERAGYNKTGARMHTCFSLVRRIGDVWPTKPRQNFESHADTYSFYHP